jgi:RNA polymerase sigma factor (sigma-70 family)
MTEANDLIKRYLLDVDHTSAIDSQDKSNIEVTKTVVTKSNESSEFGSEYARLSAISKYPPLTHEENIELAKAIEAGVFAKEQLLKDGNPPALIAALSEVQHAGEAAFEKIYLSNLRLVLKVASENNQSIPLEDRFQVGCEGLDRAIKGWDYRLGYTFATYAFNWIRQVITREIANFRSVIRLPVHVYDDISWDREDGNMLVDPGSNLAKNPFLARQIAGMFNNQFNINSVSDRAHIDWCTVSRSPTIEEVETAYEFQRIRTILSFQLDYRSWYVVWARFGFETGEAQTLEEIGKSLGVTRERVRQIEKKAMPILKAVFEEYAKELFECLSNDS